MENLSLIADSGIQFLEFKVDLSNESKALKVKQDISFLEEDGEFVFTIPSYDEDNDCYVDSFNPQKKNRRTLYYFNKSERCFGMF